MHLALFDRAAAHAGRTAIVDAAGAHDYRALLDAAGNVARRLLTEPRVAAGGEDLGEARVAYLVPPGFDYAAVQWGIWRAGGVAVPLAVSHPPPELEYVVDDAGAAAIVADPVLAGRVRPIAEARGLPLILAGDALKGPAAAAAGPTAPASPVAPAAPAVPSASLAPDAPDAPPEPNAPAAERRAMILYTSGTTSRPKGVVATHANIRAQVETLVRAWAWRADDRILLVLPLHHVHGIINVLTCALWTGARCTILPRFDAEAAWDVIARGELTLFMAVPTVYSRLIAAWEHAPPERRAACSAGCRRMRLMVSGSAALPVRVLERWREISGHTLLERYGMTEIGMALSNPLDGERRPGTVGVPLPGVYVRLVDEAGRHVPPGTPGEIEVRGPSVFREYWRRPDAAAAAFRDGWFRTGDVAVVEDGYFRILGRSSVDIIKTGGYKVSALEIEEVLRAHPDIAECAVVGVPDEEWGERVAAALVLRQAGGPDAEADPIRAWAAERLAPYKVPSRLLVVPELPRNAMGKVVKPDVAALFGAPAAGPP